MTSHQNPSLAWGLPTGPPRRAERYRLACSKLPFCRAWPWESHKRTCNNGVLGRSVMNWMQHPEPSLGYGHRRAQADGFVDAGRGGQIAARPPLTAMGGISACPGPRAPPSTPEVQTETGPMGGSTGPDHQARRPRLLKKGSNVRSRKSITRREGSETSVLQGSSREYRRRGP